MNKVLHTIPLEHQKSQYLLDLVKHDNGMHFIRIVQTSNDEGKLSKSEINIRPSLIQDLILKLQVMYDKVPKSEYEKNETLSPERIKKIVGSYMKGVSITDLTLSNDCSEETVRQILRNAGVFITDERAPARKARWKR